MGAEPRVKNPKQAARLPGAFPTWPCSGPTHTLTESTSSRLSHQSLTRTEPLVRAP